MRHLINRVCRDAGATCITVASGHEAHALAARDDLRALALVVIALTAPNQDASRPTRAACQLLQEWTTASPLLPFVCIVPASQQYAFLRIRADILRVVSIPVALPTLITIIASSLPCTSPRARGRSAIRDPETIANRDRSYGKSHGNHPLVGA
jgi:CheY-like chemotaxis protein